MLLYGSLYKFMLICWAMQKPDPLMNFEGSLYTLL